MKDILLVGDDGSSSASSGTGACIARTARFRHALETAGFRVSVLSPSEGTRGAAEIKHFLVDRSFSCIVTISPFHAEAVAIANPDLPIWIDMNGTHPAETLLLGNDDGLSGERLVRILALENTLLMRGDAFSTPSRRQAFAVRGELLLLGRMGKRSSEFIPVSPIPHCSMGVFEVNDKSSTGFRIISTGSFNLWFDEITLFNALESAMERDKSIEFISTGGRVPVSLAKYDNFRKMIEKSRFSERFTLHGWIPYDELMEVYRTASAAVYTDLPSMETTLGARTRTLDWIKRGIPVVCTDGAEISENIRSHGLGIVVPQQDHAALAKAFLQLISSPDLSENIIENQEKWCSAEGSSENLFQPLVSWCRNPSRTKTNPIGTSTIPRLNSIAYLRKIFHEISTDKGIGYAAYRVFLRIFPFFKHSGEK
ncbi:hypothetical protein DRQ25_02720 [Candidatus Fermentibacteria bacterium]|nr:MAG: hypothetical protein DRQ25_02720 [Candidatus Fermentibacteria bacterium]